VVPVLAPMSMYVLKFLIYGHAHSLIFLSLICLPWLL
jgi:hypothetical protein